MALLVDGLQAEREQSITIDVAYRFFSTAARRFVVADTPGHEQYTRNMATGAFTADLAVVGGFILVDRLSNQTIAAGMIEFALRRAANIHWQAMSIDKASRAKQKLQKPVCIWLTRLPASGKSTIASLLEKRLFTEGRRTYVLGGDNIRHGLNRDLGFSEADRVENIRRVTEIARLLVDAGLVVIVSFISPYRSERQMARSLFESGGVFRGVHRCILGRM